MQTNVVGYLLGHLFFHITLFVRHWYVKSWHIYWDAVMNRAEAFDRVLAWRITLHHLFEPLYKDYSFLGYVVGFLFRFLRLVCAFIIYSLFFGCAAIGYCVWLVVPLYALFRIIF